MKIAVYSIALNEIKHVDRYMQACQGADYIIVADTGSTDGTPERLKELGASVHNITIKPWRFDDARNAALALVPADADICVILDLDEVPQPGFFDQVRKQWKKGSDLGWVTMDTGSHWQRDRLHSRNGWHWKYPCHEVQIWYGKEPAKQCEIKDAIISHLPDNDKSRGQYLDLLELSVKEYPTDPRMWTYMTREYYFHQRWQDVINSAQKMLECSNAWDVEQAAVCRWAGESAHQLGNEEDARKWYNKGKDILPTQGEPWYGIAIDAYRKNEWERCLDASINVIEKPRSNHYCYESAIWDWKAYDLASIAAYNLRHIDESIVFAQHAYNGQGPESDRIGRNLEFFKKVKDELTSNKNPS
jgi:glycosyltransferase involved in cell wall biosynthesis